MNQKPLLDRPASTAPVPESELTIAVAANKPVHDVTRRDHVWLLLLALIPFAAATVWFAQNR